MMPIIITHSAAVMAVRLIGSVVFLSVSIFEQQMGGCSSISCLKRSASSEQSQLDCSTSLFDLIQLQTSGMAFNKSGSCAQACIPTDFCEFEFHGVNK